MELINYLNTTFITRTELLTATKVESEELKEYQNNKLMPSASYTLELNVTVNSFFGEHEEESRVEYYALGYISWLALVHKLKSPADIYQEFASRYEHAINQLNSFGFHSSDPKVNLGLNEHIQQEWQHFLQGTYGLCTKTGLPEEIAAKELAICLINELMSKAELSVEELNELESAVNLLDEASSEFAPHERLRSSRHRLVDEVRRKYKFSS